MTRPDQLAELHLRCFAAHPRPWSAPEFDALLKSPLNFLLVRPQGFLLGRAVAGEAELLTLAVAPEARRQGLGAQLLRDFAAASRARGAEMAFLEVAADNAGAIALYAGRGWENAGRRRNYYAPGLDAILMRRALGLATNG
ncbi:ribosomal-protein-alanine N-acetyltransferase [Paracoccus aminovorans]|uniref:Ribosomal-protein-alanine N-acetyltransferase n=1 Tax=Paracoccus aminovorans TaxID=34004 RepID=A0A1I3DQB6_9RHOB|nr:GNAT family N-acetyltransferase [Paracoccus aminovorans]CQR85337.1 ribosomal-protein-alanine N-acetyltransferase [Paracoccus aminovorans]SFH88934.1 ribosomal-protein-alanine N-acetyltransferase [Paracoccus aminovorans]